MSDQLYSVEQNLKSGEYHIFLSSREKNRCKLRGSSMCETMEYDINAVNIGLCITEDQAKSIVEKYGRKMCRACVKEFNNREE